MTLQGRLVATASLLFLLATPEVATATDPAPSAPAAGPAGAADKAMAEALFRAAKELQAEGQLADACAKYVESHRLDPKPGTILNVATCHEQEGRTATAWADYSEAATFAARAHQAEREKLARSKVDELGKRLSYVVFRFPDVRDLVVLLDGKALTTASAGTRVPIDPGDHTLEARAPGKTSSTTHVAIEAGPAERTVDVPPLRDERTTATASPPAPSPDAGAAPRDGSAQRAAGWVSIGIGVAAVSAGAFFGLRTLAKKSTVDEHCVGSRCDDAGLRANDAAQDSATLSTITFAVGGAAVAAGLVLLLTSAGSSPRPATTTALSLVGRGGVLQGVW